MASAAEISVRLELLKKARASGLRSLQHGDERTEYKSDAEMAAAIAADEAALAAAGNTRIVRGFRFVSDKAL